MGNDDLREALRAIVAEVAGALKLTETRKELEKLVKHSANEVAAAAVQALGAIGPEPSLEVLTRALERRKSDRLFRIRALDAMARAGSPQALKTVLRFARGKDPEMRAVAMGSLALAGSEEALRPGCWMRPRPSGRRNPSSFPMTMR